MNKSTDMEYLNAHISPLYVLVLTIISPQIMTRSKLISSLTCTFPLSFYLLCSTWPILYLKRLTYRFQSESWEDASPLSSLDLVACVMWSDKAQEVSPVLWCTFWSWPFSQTPSEQTQEPAWEDNPSLYSRLSPLACRCHLSGQAQATPHTSPACQAHPPHCPGSVFSGSPTAQALSSVGPET